MSVRQSMLAILSQGPCYGHQLRHEFERRTGGVWPVNVGQIYNTLERLERDGLVTRGETDAQGHVYWRITPAGSDDAERWLRSPVEQAGAVRDEVTIKLAVAATLPGADFSALLDAQRTATSRRLEALESPRAAHEDDTAEEFARSLVRASSIFAAEAELRWLDHVDRLVSAHPQQMLALDLTASRPKRGRPAKDQARTAGGTPFA